MQLSLIFLPYCNRLALFSNTPSWDWAQRLFWLLKKDDKEEILWLPYGDCAENTFYTPFAIILKKVCTACSTYLVLFFFDTSKAHHIAHYVCPLFQGVSCVLQASIIL